MNKNLEYYMNLPYKIIIMPPENKGDDWGASIPELNSCTAQAPQEQILSMIQESKRIWLEDALEDGDEIPEPEREKAS